MVEGKGKCSTMVEEKELWLKQGGLWMSWLMRMLTTVLTDVLTGVKIDVRPRTTDVAAGSLALAGRRVCLDRRGEER